MSATAIGALARLSARPFPSFSEAAASVLDLLEGQLPAGTVLLGHFDYDEGVYRVVDARSTSMTGLTRGTTLPLAGAMSLHGGKPDTELLASLAVRSYLAVPLETGNGSRVGNLCAMGTAVGLYDSFHLELLTVSGRLLSYEWEAVMRRAELRRLSAKLRDPAMSDPVTGLPNRQSFLASMEREWHLAQRGTVESYIVVCRAEGIEAVKERSGEAVATLLLKDAADVLSATIRRTDHAGRVSDDELGAVLVGCKGPEGAAAFCARLEQAFARASSGRPDRVKLSFGARSMAPSDSAEAALSLAEGEVGMSAAAVAGK